MSNNREALLAAQAKLIDLLEKKIAAGTDFKDTAESIKKIGEAISFCKSETKVNGFGGAQGS